jgi:hypothetical protein
MKGNNCCIGLKVYFSGFLAMIFLFPCFLSAQIIHPVVKPYEDEVWSTPLNLIDLQIAEILKKNGLKMRNPCSDSVFIRRVYLDVIGTLPKPEEIDDFMKDTKPDKRARLIDNLLKREEFALYWTMKWCDILRVKSEYPVNLWPNAVQAYYQWIYENIRKNQPYDIFVRELLTSSGSNFRIPAVNFYRAVQSKDSLSIAKAVALTFMGVRLEKMPENQQKNISLFFSLVTYKGTKEWKEEIVYSNPDTTKTIRAVLPDGRFREILPEQDPRCVFADWLISPYNEYFSKNIVNRIWAWLMGQGIISPVDDIYQKITDNNKNILGTLENELIKSNYDLKHIYRLILNSRTYQQSSILGEDKPDIFTQFAFYKVRQIDAEVLLDALCWISGRYEGYVSQIPEPYTFIPNTNRTITLADGSITSPFLMIFGRPSRDTGLESERNTSPTDKQRLYLLNSSDIQKKIKSSPVLKKAYQQVWKNKKESINLIYKIILSRFPTTEESSICEEFFTNSGLPADQSAMTIAWALINSKEFLYRH